MRLPILFLCSAASACSPATRAEVTGAGIAVPEPVTNFPRRLVPASGWTAGGEAVIAGRLVVANGCLSLESDGQIRPIVWHGDARLAADGRRVSDTRTGRSVAVGETIALAGGVYDRPSPGTANETYRDFPERCAGDKIIVVGAGFHD